MRQWLERVAAEGRDDRQAERVAARARRASAAAAAKRRAGAAGGDWADLRGALLKAGFVVRVVVDGAGATQMTVTRWGMSKTFDEVVEARRWTAMVTGATAVKEAADASA